MEKVKIKTRITKRRTKEVLDMLDTLLEKHQTRIEPWADCLRNNTGESNGKG